MTNLLTVVMSTSKFLPASFFTRKETIAIDDLFRTTHSVLLFFSTVAFLQHRFFAITTRTGMAHSLASMTLAVELFPTNIFTRTSRIDFSAGSFITHLSTKASF